MKKRADLLLVEKKIVASRTKAQAVIMAGQVFIDGKKVKFSVTEIIDKFFPEFDSDYWAERKAIEKLN